MADPKRVQRVAEQMKKDIADIIDNELKDPRIGMASITRVQLSRDLRHAKVYVSVFGDARSRQDTMAALSGAAGYIRREVGQRLGLRFAPEIDFHLDSSLEEGARVLELINREMEKGESL